MANIIERDREIEREQQQEMRSPPQHPVPSPFGNSMPDRVIGAQQVAVFRNDTEILKKLRVMAAAAGEDWFYRFPVRKKVKNEQTGKDEWVRDYVEGPSIKCANNVARLFGNCDTDTRVFDVGDAYMFYARFTDLETGYSLTRPFRQRKGQTTMKTDVGRAEDIVFQIGASKAIRNVTCNAIEFFTSFAADEAKKSIIEQVGRKLDFYKEKVLARLTEMKIDLKAVEAVRGRPLKDWLAADVARTIAELQSINDGMATIAETYLDEEPPDEHGERPAQPANVRSSLDQFAADTPSAGQSVSEPAAATPPAQAAAGTSSAPERKPDETPPMPAEPAATAHNPPAAGSQADSIETAHKRGVEARAKGVGRRAVPGEYRDPSATALAAAWVKGWDGASL